MSDFAEHLLCINFDLRSSTQSMKEKTEFLFKVLVIGDLGTGKTSIIKRYVHQFFSIHYRATVSFDSFTVNPVCRFRSGLFLSILYVQLLVECYKLNILSHYLLLWHEIYCSSLHVVAIRTLRILYLSMLYNVYLIVSDRQRAAQLVFYSI